MRTGDRATLVAGWFAAIIGGCFVVLMAAVTIWGLLELTAEILQAVERVRFWL